MLIITDVGLTFFRLSTPLLLEIFLYGLYTALFFVCICILAQAKNRHHIPFLMAAVIMFALATADLALNLHHVAYPGGVDSDLDMESTKYNFAFYLTSNTISDGLLIYRLYVIWEHRKQVIIVPSILLVVGFAVSIHYQPFWNPIPASLTLALNILVTVLIAGRISYLVYKARRLLEPSVIRRYNLTIAIIIESGIIYTLYILLSILADPHDLAAALVQVVGIMPTLIIVQVGLGRGIQNLQTSIKNVRCGEIAAPQGARVLSIRGRTSEEMSSSLV